MEIGVTAGLVVGVVVERNGVGSASVSDLHGNQNQQDGLSRPNVECDEGQTQGHSNVLA